MPGHGLTGSGPSLIYYIQDCVSTVRLMQGKRDDASLKWLMRQGLFRGEEVFLRYLAKIEHTADTTTFAIVVVPLEAPWQSLLVSSATEICPSVMAMKLQVNEKI